MRVKSTGPTTLLEAIRYFSDEDVCVKTLSATRWPDGVIPCPACGTTEQYYLAARRVWKCKECKKQFSIKVGTIMEDSPVSLTKWLPAIWMITNAKNGISSYKIHRALGVTQKTAWFMLHRIRLAMKVGSFEKLTDKVEADETFVGGRQHNRGTGRGTRGKTTVAGAIQRGGDVVTLVIPSACVATLIPFIESNVQKGATVYTDEFSSYISLGRRGYNHSSIAHWSKEYVRGDVHTNTIENFWSLLKRSIKGTYISINPEHLFRYLDEQMFRFNERKGTDGTRFSMVLSQLSGKRVTYRQLTGKERAV